MRATRSRASLTALALVLSLAGSAALGVPAAAQDDPTPAPVTIEEVQDPDSPLGQIIPKPNSGTAPEDPGDRGGALQLTVLGLIVAFFAIAVLAVRRASRRATEDRQPAG